ncbi:MAG: malto-oligosyltrehalose synthase, partial [Elusimicrobia bacterium]|nr:malto-oligosyltrehalose synthase [Elusimicrobiota bacterium]
MPGTPENAADRAARIARKLAREPRVPTSTYRLQLNRRMTFARAAELAGYLARLGVDALYCSPYLAAAPGSSHGYDVVDPTRLNAELGSTADFERLCAELERHGLGQIADVVPNHMGISGDANPWWTDVLENGPSSPYARFFDVDWSPVKAELKNRVLLPVLGELYGRVLEAGELSLGYEAGAFQVHYLDQRFPVDPKTYPLLLEPALDRLEAEVGPENPLLAELLSVLTALRNLPAAEETEPGRVAERRREKELAKRRLRALSDSSPQLREWLGQVVKRINGAPGQPDSFAALHRLLEAQRYRLAYWRTSDDEVNYRRFFDINALAAIRVEDDEVFALHHGLLLRLVREGRIQGLRIDHPDGLYDPAGYFRRLQERCLQALVARALDSSGPDLTQTAAAAAHEAMALAAPGRPPFYVVAEKILDRQEELPETWSIFGTVGYEYLNALNGLFVERIKETEFDKGYRDYIGHAIDYDRLVYDKKKFFCLVNMASETSTLGHRLDQISELEWNYRDLTRNHLTLAIREVLACFPVYRTYIPAGAGPVCERDQRYIRTAIGKARDRLPALHPGAFDFLERVLLARPESGPAAPLYRDFALRFQQLSGPIMAKGVEDTAFYVFNRLLSLNEVGGDPTRFGWDRSEFHEYLRGRRNDWPAAMLATSTHDTKRSEDMRLRLDVLSEIPREWQARLAEWSGLNAQHKTPIAKTLEPRANTEYFIYQTLLGVWPNETLDRAGRAALLERVWQTVLKSSREAKIYTDWAHPDADYEEALRKFVTGIASDDKFLKAFLPFQEKLAFYGMLNSLSALTLKLAAPGVPDTYQGNELWDYSLVDPDNRRDVDFELRTRHLQSLIAREGGCGPTPELARALCESWRDGRLKMHVLRQGLLLRRRRGELFLQGEYLPLEAQGLRQR